jgi:diguanylate cyclase (GGDEF)-like protein
MIFQIQNITERKRAEEHIHHAAFHDALTGLPNRTRLSNHLSMAVERAKRNRDYQFAVLFVDLDRFKVVNDSLGHNLGDKLLVELSRRLEQSVRKVDTVARLGGDEFGILLDEVKETNEATQIAERIQESLKVPFDLNGHQFFATASIGIAFSLTGYNSPEDMLRDADTAMYRAKANGKARYEVFNIDMHTRAVEALKMENDLRSALERQDVKPFYQPIVSLTTGRIIGFEALARWQHPDRGIILPADFISLAEETGLIIPLGMSVLSQSCSQVREWQKLYPSEQPLSLSVNLSGKQFRQTDLVEEISRILAVAELPPDCLRLELTESVIMENAEQASEMLGRLKGIGVQISIDDFGTGYSSLSHLHRFPFDILKIDRSFVSRISVDNESRGIIKTIMMLAAELDKVVVAEGIETDEQMRMLKDLACPYAQGYLFSKPIDAEAAHGLLEHGLPRLTENISAGQNFQGEDVDLLGGVYAM